MDLIEQGIIGKNFIEPSFELVDTFNRYWSRIMPLGSTTTMALPFFFLQSEGFWQLNPKHGSESKIRRESKSMKSLRDMIAGATLDEQLFQFMKGTNTRTSLRTILVKTYFAEELQPIILEQIHINYDAYQYSKALLETHESAETLESTETNQKVRDQGFRKAIVTLYDHRCALCGIRMLTTEGHTVVEGAHIIPWSISHNDQPTNGMSLCRLCHWSFDEGFVSVNQDYQVVVSRQVRLDQNLPGHILTLSDRNIFTPEKEHFWPAQENLNWHRKKVYRK
ncbi:MAG: HNH endonuclease [Deltaproteobacteria bacterium]|nr:HNH endonuclease [Deltaproteobacteria bacterium]